jgi:DNA (cytosine-5)-methyltransferase 1
MEVQMHHGSLFSGGGGFDLAAQMAGWRNIFHCEKDQFCQHILKFYWPKAKSYSDIRTFNGKQYQGKIDIISGGFPCQPFSIAGKRKGTEDDRYLWPEMLRVIRAVKPRWVVGENVLGFANWNAGLVFKQVLSELEAEGFEVWPYVLPASGINAPHQRYRVWIVAHHGKRPLVRNPRFDNGRSHSSALEAPSADTDNNGCRHRYGKHEKLTNKARKHAQRDLKPMGKHVANTPSKRVQGVNKTQNRDEWEKALRQFTRFSDYRRWESWPSQSPLCGGDDGLPAELDGITFSKWRSQSLKVYGNAIVPQLALRIFKAIESYEVNYAE